MISSVLLLLSTLLAVTYATVTTPCQANGLASSYDVIIIGGGLGGSVASRRLAEANPSWQILQLERGIPYEACATCQLTSQTTLIYAETQSGGFISSVPQTNVNNNVFRIKDPAVQGGGTSVNGAAHIRGDAWRYFPEYYPASWNWQVMQNFYERYENYTFNSTFHGGAPYSYAANLRGNHGPVEADQQPLRPFTQSYLNAIKQVYPNMPVYYTRSLNDGEFPGVGAAPPEITAQGNVRVSAYTAYIKTYQGTNLKLTTNVLANKVLFQGTTVVGVNITFYNGSASQPTNSSCIVATSRVVMAAGTFGTPKILKLSGIGPAAELQSFGIPVVVNSPAVGANLADHFILFTAYSGYKDNLATNDFPNQVANTFYNAEDNGPLALNDFSYNLGKTPTPGIISLTASRTNMHSRGTVTLNSTDAHVSPLVDMNYFGGFPGDRNASALATFKQRQLAVLLNLTNIADPCAGVPCDTPMEVFNAYVNKSAVSVGYHFTSTASLCEVVNPVSLRVEGTTGLYVLDASIMPQSPACNTQASLYAVAEYGSALINLNMHLDSAGSELEEILGWALCELEEF